MANPMNHLPIAMGPRVNARDYQVVEWGCKWVGYRFEEVVRQDPHYAGFLAQVVHRTPGQQRFLEYAIIEAMEPNATQPGGLYMPQGPAVAGGTVNWGNKWFGFSFTEVLRCDPDYVLWVRDHVVFKTREQEAIVLFAHEDGANHVPGAYPAPHEHPMFPGELGVRDLLPDVSNRCLTLARVLPAVTVRGATQMLFARVGPFEMSLAMVPPPCRLEIPSPHSDRPAKGPVSSLSVVGGGEGPAAPGPRLTGRGGRRGSF